MEDSKFEKVICWIVIAVFLCSLIGLIGYLVWDANQDKIEEDIQKIHDEAAELVALPSVIEERPEERTEIVYQPTDAPKPTGVPSLTPVPTLEPTESPTPEPTREPEQKSGGTVNSGNISLEQLYAINPDIAGWIRIPGTEVDYPFAAVGNKKSI